MEFHNNTYVEKLFTQCFQLPGDWPGRAENDALLLAAAGEVCCSLPPPGL